MMTTSSNSQEMAKQHLETVESNVPQKKEKNYSSPRRQTG